jgi:hypothetical protein
MMQRFMCDCELPWLSHDSFTSISSGKSQYILNCYEEHGLLPASHQAGACLAPPLDGLFGDRFVVLLEVVHLLKQPAKDVVQLLGRWAKCFLSRGDTGPEKHIMAWLITLLCRQ